MPEVLAGSENPSKRLVPAWRPARLDLSRTIVVQTPDTLPSPIRIRVEGASGPTKREGRRYLSSRGKVRTSPPILRSLYWLDRGSLKSGTDHPHDLSMFLPWTYGVAGARGYALHSRPTKEERLMMDMLR
jgi:hypothetical protein